MGERKVLNKYYPPDFDPSKLVRRRRQQKEKQIQIKVRMMLPMSIRCDTCGNYIYKGTKFNSRKEDVIGQTYLGIQIFRFYFKCTGCSAELIMKTDPQNSDYVVEAGATRNFEPWRAEYEGVEQEKMRRDEEKQKGDVMKSLERRSVEYKREINSLAVLDELKSMKSRHAYVSVDAALEALQRSSTEEKKRKLEEADEELIRSVFPQASKSHVRRRIYGEDEAMGKPTDSKWRKVSDEDVRKPRKGSTVHDYESSKINDELAVFKASSVSVSFVKKLMPPSTGNKQQEEEKNNQEEEPKAHDTINGLQSLYQDYGSSDESDQ